jgi:hypothetical protein
MGRTASCSYYHVLLDGTTTGGIYGKEKATVSLSGRRMAKLSGLILGCSTFKVGSSVDSNDGVLALGNNDISFGADGGEWRRRRCGRRRMEAATRTEARMEAVTRTEADGGGDTNGGADDDGGGDLDGDASVEGGRQDAGPVDRTRSGHGATGAQAHRRLLQLAASYPHRLLRLASSRGDESRENEIKFCVREEQKREIRREERFVLLSRESWDRNLWLW